MKAEQIPSEAGHEKGQEYTPPELEVSLSDHGAIRVRGSEGGGDNFVTFDDEIGSFDVTDGKAIATIGKHHIRTLVEAQDIDQLLEQHGRAIGAHEIAIIRSEDKFNEGEMLTLESFGYREKQVDRILHHHRRMVKQLSDSE